MIKPTVGRVVWYYPGGEIAKAAGDQPRAAIVAHVHHDRSINIAWFGRDGKPNQAQNVPLLQDDDVMPADEFCMWMPYQHGQAAKTEALERQIASGSQDRAS